MPLLRFACRAALPGFALLALIIAGCSGGEDAVAPPEDAARAAQAHEGERGALPRLAPAPDEAPPGGAVPAGTGVDDPQRPAFTPHWYTPSVDPLFRRRPLPQGPRRRLPPSGPPATEPSPAPHAAPPAAGVEAEARALARLEEDGPAPNLKDFHVIAPLLDGVASWYGPGFHGKRTANGEVYDQHRLTAAHPSLPMGTVIRVENRANGRVVWVRVNDRGPYAKGRVLDLSRAAAERLDMIGAGTAPVRIAVLRWPSTTDHRLGLRAYTQYVVQVAAYDEPEKVESLLVRMQARFDGTPFTVDPRPNGMLSVIAGPFDEHDEARRIMRRLQRAGVTGMVRRYRK